VILLASIPRSILLKSFALLLLLPLSLLSLSDLDDVAPLLVSGLSSLLALALEVFALRTGEEGTADEVQEEGDEEDFEDGEAGEEGLNTSGKYSAAFWGRWTSKRCRRCQSRTHFAVVLVKGGKLHLVGRPQDLLDGFEERCCVVHSGHM
jgi:hypothetical protein